MVMSEQTGDAKRDGARIFGVIFQFLAFVSIVATLFAMARIASLGNAFGVDPTNDPLIWFVLASGIFVTCVFMGIGYTLGILCAIYDRQESKQVVATKVPAAYAPKPPPQRPNPIVPVRNVDRDSPPVTDGVSHAPALPVQSQAPDVAQKSALAEWLTRERHFRSPKRG